MKTVFVSIIAVLFSTIIYGNNFCGLQRKISVDTLPTEQLVTYLQNLDIPSFYGKPVDSFLLNVPANIYNLKIFPGSSSQGASYHASFVRFFYSGGLIVKIYVTEYTHMNRYSPTWNWDFNLFRQEKIDRIDIWLSEWACLTGGCLQ